MSNLPIKKVYIDSRFKTSDSASDTHFKYELVESLQLPENTVCLSMMLLSLIVILTLIVITIYYV